VEWLDQTILSFGDTGQKGTAFLPAGTYPIGASFIGI
jgi:hypothetical protein